VLYELCISIVQLTLIVVTRLDLPDELPNLHGFPPITTGMRSISGFIALPLTTRISAITVYWPAGSLPSSSIMVWSADQSVTALVTASKPLGTRKAASLFSSVSELLRRDLVQRPGVWRAVLPHAIANRLAAGALQDIPFTAIEAQLIDGGPSRLLGSFSRRLGYLETSPEAVRIATSWLPPSSLLGDIGNLNDLGRSIFKNIAPVVPQETLAAIERAFAAPVAWAKDLVELVHALAWDLALFERSVALLAKIAAQGDNTGAGESITAMFQLFLSGTRASIEQRVRLADSLLCSADPALQSAGLLALGGWLEAWHFTSNRHFQFGARSRDVGYWPRRDEDTREWFDAGLSLARHVIAKNLAVAPKIRRIVAQRFRGLWTKAAMYDGLEEISRAMIEQRHWSEGWIAARQTIQYGHEAFTPEVMARLRGLGGLHAAQKPVEKVQAVVFREDHPLVDFEGFDLDADKAEGIRGGYERAEQIAQTLGEAVVRDNAALRELLPKLLSGSGRLTSFGRGLAMACAVPEDPWNRLVAQLALTPEDNRNIQVLRGFLAGLDTRDPGLAGALLDRAIEHDVLGPYSRYCKAPCSSTRMVLRASPAHSPVNEHL
jgi:hypothetical protein